ncbi:MAG: tRNA preQ1(34) S-adenosylmethionine ribosyltransferase-isomerase QueA [Syntrophobacterales bacterium]|nr:tRNA preQ1(34) S-adenosylmethionine ribosyltransferase-isomerase QueA [Syntrophobacterales bacterium]
MKTRLEEFDYHLPGDLIAQRPAESRDSSRMMVLDRRSGECRDCCFAQIIDFLGKGDCLVINDSRVIPARLLAVKETGGRVEILLLRKVDGSAHRWEVLLKPGGRVSPGMRFRLGEDAWAEAVERAGEKKWVVDFNLRIEFTDFVENYGLVPLPPYIRRNRNSEEPLELLDRMRYQTVYARVPGSVAAPTAGLHFSEGVMEKIAAAGVAIAPVTLHVGYGTFRPIESDFIDDHVMEDEYFEVSDESAEKINRAVRVVAVGTTSTRVLESVSDEKGRVKPTGGYTGLFIRPGYRFKRVNALLTNFHLPKSTLYVLACAFAGRDLIRKTYAKAVGDHYRFYSYGDCMLIL